MDNTFFGFNTTLNDHGERLGSSPEDIEGLEAEEEYDALNDETFGTLEESDLDDWEAQHEQLAEIAESTRHSNEIESFINNLSINDDARDKRVWAYNDVKNGEKSQNTRNADSTKFFPNQILEEKDPLSILLDLVPSNSIRAGTVEEIERSLFGQSKPTQPRPLSQQQQQQHQQHQPNQQQHPLQQQHQQQPPPFHGPMPQRLPPGFQPIMVAPQPTQMWQYPVRPGMMRVMPRVPPPPVMMPPPPGFMHHHNNFPQQLNPQHFNFPPPPRVIPQNMQNRPHQKQQQHQQHHHPQQQQQQQQQQQHRDVNHRSRSNDQRGMGEPRDEYAGLMNNREKQWLLNIQLLQVNTGTPYFDDYYYTVFKERHSKSNKENVSSNNSSGQNQQQRFQQRYQRDGHHRDGHHRNNERNEQQPPMNKKTYTPLQFENSLGKLQFGSVTAPRKIIDMDVISHDKDSDSTSNSRDSRKTKQLLLELEALYSLMLKAEDLKNPVAISNTEKLKELKQKQRLREIEAAPTAEAKQEVLKLLQQESLEVVENQQDILAKMLHVLLQDDKIVSFLGIRKGKMLLLRLLPQLPIEHFRSQLLELWTKFVGGIPVVGRRDAIGENVLPRFYPLFKRYLESCSPSSLAELRSGLAESSRLDSRSTPVSTSGQSKTPLHYVMTSKIGVSVLAALVARTEAIADLFTAHQLADWCEFLVGMSEAAGAVNSLAVPIEPLDRPLLAKHLSRLPAMRDRTHLERLFVRDAVA